MNQEEKLSRNSRIPIVGIGVSAVGLAALEKFFANLPDNLGMAFVIILSDDLPAQQKVTSILQEHTAMQVHEVEEKTDVGANCIYVVPAGKTASINKEGLNLSRTRPASKKRMSIDLFLRSLAAEQKENAICVILSGTGSDGLLGLKSIKESGGLILLQDPQEAEDNAMLQSAISMGVADLVAPAAELATTLVEYKKGAHRIAMSSVEEMLTDEENVSLSHIFAQLRHQTGHDFSPYKRTTILRRIRRRMQVNQITTLADYLTFLRPRREEIHALFKDFLISVTNFFRDEDAFAALETEIVPQLMQGKRPEESIRVWVPGCATGEEAYSIAILFIEAFQRAGQSLSMQIFATDLDDEALDFARRGLYPNTITADISAKRLQHFFTQEARGYRVSKQLQEVVLFAPHNLIKDAPFARLDLISCRNLLIYLNREVQRQVFEIFHYALRPEGFLFLGGSESADTMPDLFKTVNKHHRIFQRQPAQANLPLLPVSVPSTKNAVGNNSPTQSNQAKSANLSVIHRDLLLQRYGLPSIIVDANYQIRYKYGNVSRYLEHREGEPSHDILENVNQQMRSELRMGLYHVFRYREASLPRHVEITIDEKVRRLKLIVEPIEVNEVLENSSEPLALVIFEALPEEESSKRAEYIGAERDDITLVEQLEEELKETRHRLQTIVEEYETSNEELKASNQELQSINEELRSTTEELETGREELRSTNEELASVNQELNSKILEIDRAYNDLENLMQATLIPTLFLDRKLYLKRYTPDASDLFNVIASDIGRPFDHISHKLHFDGLPSLAATVLKTLETVEIRVSSRDKRWFLLRLRPYRTLEDKVDGVVITLVDITSQVQAEQIQRNRAQRQAIVAELGQVALLNNDLQALTDIAVQRIVEVLHVDYAKVLELLPDKQSLLLRAGIGWQEGLVGRATVSAGQNSQAGFTLQTDEPVIVEDLTTETRFNGPPLLHEHQVISGLSVIIQAADRPYGVIGAHTRERRLFTSQDADFLQSVANVLGTAVIRQRAEEERLTLLDRVQHERQLLESVIQQMPAGVIIADSSSGRLVMGNSKVEEIWRHPFQAADEISNYADLYRGYHPDNRPYKSEEWPLARALSTGQVVQNEEIGFRRGDDTQGIMSVSAAPIFNQEGQTIAGVVVFEDITTRKKIEQTLKQYKDILGLSYDAILIWRLDGGIQFWNRGAENLYGYTAEEALEQNNHKLLQTVHSQPFDEIHRQLLKEGNWEGELRHVTKASRQVIVSSRHQLLSDIGEGNLVLEVNRDITEHKQVQLDREKLLQELQLLTSNLEERVEQRTQQIKALASFLTIAEQRERERISHILHDDLQQILHALQLRLLIIRAKSPEAGSNEEANLQTANNEQFQGQLEGLEELSNRALQITRSLTVELSPPLLTEDGLVEAFSWLVGHMEEIYGLQVHLIVEEKLALLNNNMRELIFQMVRELLFNVIKHADVQEAVLKIWQNEGFSFIQVADKGRGFDLAEVESQSLVSYGLRSIRERISLFGGSLEIHTALDVGTVITLSLPSRPLVY